MKTSAYCRKHGRQWAQYHASMEYDTDKKRWVDMGAWYCMADDEDRPHGICGKAMRPPCLKMDEWPVGT